MDEKQAYNSARHWRRTQMTKLGTDTSTANSFQEEIYCTSDGTLAERGSWHSLSFISQLNGHESLRQHFVLTAFASENIYFNQQYSTIHRPFLQVAY